MSFGQNLQRARRLKGYQIYSLSAVSHIPQSKLKAFEEDTQMPSKQEVELLASLLDTTAQQLFNGVSSQPASQPEAQKQPAKAATTDDITSALQQLETETNERLAQTTAKGGFVDPEYLRQQARKHSSNAGNASQAKTQPKKQTQQKANVGQSKPQHPSISGLISDPVSLGQKMKEIRNAQNWSYKQITKALKVRLSDYILLEEGKVKPNEELRLLIYKMFGV